MPITIHTQLDTGIYASCGGGKDVTYYEWAVGPRNLMTAISVLAKHRASMKSSYGNIGCGGSWLEIDGVRIARVDIDDISTAAEIREMDDRCLGERSPTPTSVARGLLTEIANGTYSNTRQAWAAQIATEHKKEYDAAIEKAETEDRALAW